MKYTQKFQKFQKVDWSNGGKYYEDKKFYPVPTILLTLGFSALGYLIYWGLTGF